MIVQRRWNLASFHGRAHAECCGGKQSSDNSGLASGHSVLLFDFLKKQKHQQIFTGGNRGRERRQVLKRSRAPLGHHGSSGTEGIWFLFVRGRRIKRRSLAEQLASSSLSGPGRDNKRGLCGGEERCLRVPVSSVCPLFLLSQITKLENNRRVGPASLCDLDRELSPSSLSSKKGLPDFRPGSKRPHLPWHSRSSHGISFGLTLGTNTQMYCSSLISRKVACQNLHVVLTDGSWLAVA